LGEFEGVLPLNTQVWTWERGINWQKWWKKDIWGRPRRKKVRFCWKTLNFMSSH